MHDFAWWRLAADQVKSSSDFGGDRHIDREPLKGSAYRFLTVAVARFVGGAGSVVTLVARGAQIPPSSGRGQVSHLHINKPTRTASGGSHRLEFRCAP